MIVIWNDAKLFDWYDKVVYTNTSDLERINTDVASAVFDENIQFGYAAVIECTSRGPKSHTDIVLSPGGVLTPEWFLEMAAILFLKCGFSVKLNLIRDPSVIDTTLRNIGQERLYYLGIEYSDHLYSQTDATNAGKISEFVGVLSELDGAIDEYYIDQTFVYSRNEWHIVTGKDEFNWQVRDVFAKMKMAHMIDDYSTFFDKNRLRVHVRRLSREYPIDFIDSVQKKLMTLGDKIGVYQNKTYHYVSMAEALAGLDMLNLVCE